MMTVFNVPHQQRTNKAKVFDLQIYTWPTKLVILIMLDFILNRNCLKTGTLSVTVLVKEHKYYVRF